ncbi:MAG TPA: hypothetical protein VFY73_03365 [Ideonella sp.]|uniref:hypothetical protein n=1 Tax=Ideonella sp. TaxID=1929293 RepID=UPI002E3373F1|nr:hypothetical protein [Ideonella sp.]HEX5683053.1 hypothetical protein [Ideonella sp.]
MSQPSERPFARDLTPISQALALAGLLALHLGAQGAPTYTCQVLQDNSPSPSTVASDINNRGEILGRATYAADKSNGAVVWKRDGRIVPLLPRDPALIDGSAINDAGQVVGTRYRHSGPGKVVVWSGNTRIYMDALVGPDGFSNGSDINQAGHAVGSSQVKLGDFTAHATLWKDGAVTDLGGLAETDESSANGINDSGVIVGRSGPKNGDYRAVQWDAKGITDLGTLPDHVRSHASRINRDGIVIGFSSAKHDFAPRPVAWKEGVIHDLGTLPGHPFGIVGAINADGKMVGSSFDKNFSGDIPTLWLAVGRKPLDLNTLIPNGCVDAQGVSWSLQRATGINDRGEITAFGEKTDTGYKTAAFRLTPL